MRKQLLGALGLLTFTAAPLLAQAPPPLPVPYNPPSPTTASTAAFQAPPSTTTTTVYQAPPPPPPPLPPSEGIAPPAGAVPVFPDYGGPVPMRLVPVNTEPYHVWVHAELLLWWVKSTPLPAPIAAVTDGAGNSSTVIGSGSTGFGAFSGGRVAMGAWFDRDNHIGFEAGFFGLERRVSNQSAFSDGNGIPSVGLSFLNAAPGQSGEFIQPLSVPGTFGGGVLVTQTLEMWGTEVNAAFCFLRSGGFEITGLAGFRYLDLQENLYINATSTDLTSGNFINLNDQFSTHNQFYGGQLGAKVGWQSGPLALEATGKLAVGGTHQSVDIQGSSYVSGVGTFPNSGFYAQPSNVGHYTATQFGIVPSVELKLSYQLSRAWRLFVGYDFLYWNQVVRPGNQIDRNVNLNQSPVLGAGTPGGSPMPLFNRSDFWAQGLNLGFELRF